MEYKKFNYIFKGEDLRLKFSKKENLGITLVALVITIILLLILAGITISQLQDSGLFEKGKISKGKAQNAQELENSLLADYENEINLYSIGAPRTGEGTENQELDYRAGTIDFGKINSKGEVSRTITFSEPMEDNQYSVVVTCTGGGTNWAQVEYIVRTKTVNGFTINAYNNAGGATGSSVTADYIVIPTK